MTNVNESIFDNKRVTIPMADVQHVEAISKGSWVITRHTRYDMINDIWANPIYLDQEETKQFLKAWCVYRHELEGIK
jgi:uncharacterized protein YecA (UPF0149 family)